MRLFIAEKPSVAKAISSELGATGKGDGYIQCGDDKITWCFGHMLEQAGPDEYTPDDVPVNGSGRKIWRVDELPIIPDSWMLRPKPAAKKQLSLIGKLIKSADEIVNAGDPDREGQLLVDEVLEHFGNNKPVRRFWVSSQDSVTVRRGLSALKDNREYAGWGRRGPRPWPCRLADRHEPQSCFHPTGAAWRLQGIAYRGTGANPYACSCRRQGPRNRGIQAGSLSHDPR